MNARFVESNLYDYLFGRLFGADRLVGKRDAVKTADAGCGRRIADWYGGVCGEQNFKFASIVDRVAIEILASPIAGTDNP